MVEPNALEIALERATNDPGMRPPFYKLLMASQVFVLADAQIESKTQPRSLVAWVREDNVHVIPFFSSVGALPPAHVPGLGVVRVPVRGLFEATPGMHLHLNPGSTFGREFTPDEVASLLASNTIHYGMGAVSLRAGTEIQIDRLLTPLLAMEAALTSLLLAYPAVSCSHLVEMERQQDGTRVRAVTLIVEGPQETPLAQAIATVISDLYRGELPIELCFAGSADELVLALRNVDAVPFYDRASATCSEVTHRTTVI
jgi:hypothetical protein